MTMGRPMNAGILALGALLAIQRNTAASEPEPRVVSKDPVLAALVGRAVKTGPRVQERSQHSEPKILPKADTTIEIRLLGERSLVVTLLTGRSIVASRRLDFSASPQPFDAAEAVALAYREMTSAPRLQATETIPPPHLAPRPAAAAGIVAPIRADATIGPSGATKIATIPRSESRPSEPASSVGKPTTSRSPAAANRKLSERPSNEAPKPKPEKPEAAPQSAETILPLAAASIQSRRWAVSLAPMLLVPDTGPSCFAPALAVARDLGRWWVVRLTVTPGFLRTGAISADGEGDVRLYTAEIAAGPRLQFGPVFASLAAGGGVLYASGSSGETVAVLSTDLDLNFSVHPRIRVGLRVGGLLNPKGLSQSEDAQSEATAPVALFRAAADVRFLF